MTAKKPLQVMILGLSIFYILGSSSNAMDSSGGTDNQTPLAALGEKYHTDKQYNHNFLEFYEFFFKPIRLTAKKIFEIGILNGASLKLWQDYFPNAKIYGIDIRDLSAFNTDRVTALVADQANRDQLKSAIDVVGNDIDIIIDDGGHAMNMQQISFGYLFKYLKPGGLYIIEDLHTSLADYYPTGFGNTEDGGANTTLKMIYNYINTGKIESKYLTSDEIKILNKDIEYCTVFYRTTRQHSITGVFQKKKIIPALTTH